MTKNFSKTFWIFPIHYWETLFYFILFFFFSLFFFFCYFQKKEILYWLELDWPWLISGECWLVSDHLTMNLSLICLTPPIWVGRNQILSPTTPSQFKIHLKSNLRILTFSTSYLPWIKLWLSGSFANFIV